MIFIIVTIFAWIVTFLMMHDVFVFGNALEVSFELALSLALRQRTDLHVDVTTGHFGLLIQMPHGDEIFFDLIGQGKSKLLMGHLTTAELQLDTHLMTFSKKVFRMDNLDPVIMRIDSNTEFQFLHFAAFVVLMSFLLLLFKRVFVLAVVDDFADGWIDVRGDFNKIDTALPGHAQGYGGHEHTILLIGAAIDDSNFWGAYAFIDTSLINIPSIRRASVSLLAWAIEITSRTGRASASWAITSLGWRVSSTCGSWALCWREASAGLRWARLIRGRSSRRALRWIAALIWAARELTATQVIEWIAYREPPGG